MEAQYASHMQTLSQGMEELRSNGFKYEFSLSSEGGIEAKELEMKYNAKQCEVKETRRYEGNSNPADMSILYAIETNDGKKGVLVNSYGANGSEEIDQFIRKAEVK